MAISFTPKNSSASSELAPFGKCPVCKKPLSLEMIPMGYEKPDEKGKQKKKIPFAVLLPQILRYTIETSIRAMVSSGRSLYYYCGNEDCPAHYTPLNQFYFKKTVVGTFELVGDATGIRLSALQGQFGKKKKKK